MTTSRTSAADELLDLAKDDAIRAIEHVRASLPGISSIAARSLLHDAESLFGLLEGVAVSTRLAELAHDELARHEHAEDARGLARSAYLEALRRVEEARARDPVLVLRLS